MFCFICNSEGFKLIFDQCSNCFAKIIKDLCFKNVMIRGKSSLGSVHRLPLWILFLTDSSQLLRYFFYLIERQLSSIVHLNVFFLICYLNNADFIYSKSYIFDIARSSAFFWFWFGFFRFDDDKSYFSVHVSYRRKWDSLQIFVFWATKNDDFRCGAECLWLQFFDGRKCSEVPKTFFFCFGFLYYHWCKSQ